MAVLPGIVASANVSGRQLALPAITSANQDSAYVFASGSTTIGSLVFNRKTGGSWVLPGYDNVTDSMTFNGTSQSVSYVPASTALHASPPPFSLQVDFNTDRVNVHQYVVNMGQGNGIGYPEFIVDLANTNLAIVMNGSSSGSIPMSYTVSTTIAAGQWYRVGAMIYNSGGTNYLRVYLNGERKVQTALPALPYNTSTAGIAIGNDNANFGGTFYKGKIRNLFIGKTLFWTI